MKSEKNQANYEGRETILSLRVLCLFSSLLSFLSNSSRLSLASLLGSFFVRIYKRRNIRVVFGREKKKEINLLLFRSQPLIFVKIRTRKASFLEIRVWKNLNGLDRNNRIL